MWVNFFWFCKGTNDDGQLQAPTVLIQVSLQKYYLLLVFCPYISCRKLVLLMSSRAYLKKLLHSREMDIFIFIFALTISKTSIFFRSSPLAGCQNKNLYIHKKWVVAPYDKGDKQSGNNRTMHKLQSYHLRRQEAFENWSENTLLYNASDLRKTYV
jgi:hypothetical protein